MNVNDVVLQFHNCRKRVLYDVFDNPEDIEINDWGEPDDSQSHGFQPTINLRLKKMKY